MVGSELRKSFAIPVDGVFGPNEPVVTGERKVGAQLAVSTDHNSWIVVESIEWRRQGEGDVLSTIELLRAESPGNYQVTMTYWVRTIVAEYKPPSKTWTKPSPSRRLRVPQSPKLAEMFKIMSLTCWIHIAQTRMKRLLTHLFMTSSD